MKVSGSLHGFEIRPRDPEKPMTGMNTQVLMDGVVMKGVRSLRLDIEAGKQASLFLEIIPGAVSLKGSLDSEISPSSFVEAIGAIE